MHHVVKVVVVGDGDESVEVFAGELVLEGDVVVLGVAEGGEFGKHGGELDGAVDGEDFGVAADVGELVVVGAWVDLAAIAADELGFVVLVVPWRRVLEVDLSGAWRGLA